MPAEKNLRPEKQMPRNADLGKRRLNFTQRHGRDAEANVAERDSPFWDVYYNYDLKAFKRKTGSIVIGGKKASARDVYVSTYKQGKLKAPSGFLFDTGLGRLVKQRGLRKGETLNGSIIYNGDYTNSDSIPTGSLNDFQSGDYTMTLEFYGGVDESKRNGVDTSNHKNVLVESLIKPTGFADKQKVLMEDTLTLLCDPKILNISAADLAKMHRKPYTKVDQGGNRYYIGSADYELLMGLIKKRDGCSSLEAESGDRIRVIVVTRIDVNANPVNRAPADQLLSSAKAPQILSNKYIPLSYKDGKFVSSLPFCTDDDCVPQTFKEWMADPLSIPKEDFISHFLQLLNHTYSTTMSLTDVIPFLSIHRLKLTALNIAQEVDFHWEPAMVGLSENHHVKGLHLKVVIHNGHIYKLDGVENEKERTYNSLMRKKFPDNRSTAPPKPSHSMHVPDLTTYDAYAETMDDLFAIMAKPVDVKTKSVRIAFCGGAGPDHKSGDLMKMEQLLKHFHAAHSLEPQMIVKKNKIHSMTLWFLKHRVTICNIGVKQQPREFNEWLNKFKRAVFHESHKSTYSLNFRKAFTDMRLPQLYARFHDDVPHEAIGVDVTRFYPAALMMQPRLPRLLFTDDFRTYRGEPIDDYNFYQVLNDEPFNTEKCFICNRTLGVLTGFVLNRCGLTFKILKVSKPSLVYDNPFPAIVKELYAADVCTDIKKQVPLFTIGIAGRMWNQNEQSFFTTSHEEACWLGDEVSSVPYLGGYFAKRQTEEVLLHDGFYPIQHVTYVNARLMALNLYRKLKAEGVKVYGIHTDCIFVDRWPDWDYVKTTTFEKIGGFRKEGYKHVPKWPLEIIDGDDILTPCDDKVPTIVSKKTPGVDTAVVGKVAGVGKTFASALGLDPANTLFVTGCNNRCEDIRNGKDLPGGIGFESATCASVLGIRVAGDGQEVSGRNAKPKKLNKYTHVVLDELAQNDMVIISRLMELKMQYPDITWICNGDANQNTNGSSDNAEHKAFYTDIINRYFAEHIYLTESRRLLSAEDRAKIHVIHDDLFVHKIGIGACIQKHFPKQCFKDKAFLKERGIKKAITLSNPNAHIVNQYLHDKQPDAPGMKVLLKTYTSGFIQNKMYEVQALLPNKYIIDGVELSRLRFRLPHALTCHIAQGDTWTEDYAIFQSLSDHANVEWFWTAVTRCKDFSKVWIYTGKPLLDFNATNKKIEGYKAQDKKAGRPNNLTYTNVMAFLGKKNFKCDICSTCMEFEWDDDTKDLQWTLDRLNNDGGHTFADKDHVGNLRTAHWACNRAHANDGKILLPTEEEDAF